MLSDRKWQFAFIILIVIVIVGGFIQTTNSHPGIPLSPPSHVNIMGTNHLGEDIWLKLSDSTVRTLLVSILGCGWAMIAGLFIGGYSALSHSRSAFYTMRITEIFLPVPSLLLGMIFLLGSKNGLISISLAVGLPLIPFVARHCRSLILPVSEKEYVKAAILAGGSTTYIITRHILTSLKKDLSALLVTTFSWCLLNLTSLDFLGLIREQDFISLGKMINEGRLYIFSAPWIISPPAMMVILIMLCLNIITYAERD